MEYNLKMGPLCELSLCHYRLVSSGSSPQEAVAKLQTQLEVWDRNNFELHKTTIAKFSFKKWLSDFRLRRMFRKWEKEGFINPVKVPNE